MNSLHGKVLSNICISPSVIIPATSGISLLLLSVVLGPEWAFLGSCLCLASIGITLTRFFLYWEQDLEEIIRRGYQEKIRKRNDQLDLLDQKLLLDRDPRDQTALRNLRAIYDSFMEDVKSGVISSAVTADLCNNIEQLFENCVNQLQKQHDMWTLSGKLTGEYRKEINKRRNAILEEVEAIIATLTKTTDEIRILGLKGDNGELSKIQTQLRVQLETAKKIDEMTSVDYMDFSQFEGYEN